jgi:hypothetical protein
MNNLKLSSLQGSWTLFLWKNMPITTYVTYSNQTPQKQPNPTQFNHYQLTIISKKTLFFQVIILFNHYFFKFSIIDLNVYWTWNSTMNHHTILNHHDDSIHVLHLQVVCHKVINTSTRLNMCIKFLLGTSVFQESTW